MTWITSRMRKAADMHVYLADDPVISIIGAPHLENLGRGGLRPHRLPARALRFIPTSSMHTIVAAAAGVRVRFVTSATTLSVRLAVRPIEIVGASASYCASLDLVVNGRVAQTRLLTGEPIIVDDGVDDPTISSATPVDVRFDGLQQGEKTIELWLPHTAITDLFEIHANQPVSRAVDEGTVRWLHYGSSISHCLEAPQPTQTWPARVALEMGWDLIDLGFAGNALLDPFVARAIGDMPVDLITLKIGINLTTSAAMRLRTFAPAVHGFLDTIRERQPETPIMLISPIASPALEQHPGPIRLDPQTKMVEGDAIVADQSLTLERVRTVLSSVVAERSSDDPRLSYVNGCRLFSLEDSARGFLPDGLHPNADGYQLIATRFTALIRESGWDLAPTPGALP